jgi:YggT family protein
MAPTEGAETGAQQRVGAIYGPGSTESRTPRVGITGLACLPAGDPLPFATFRKQHRMRSILYVILLLLDIYIWLLIAAAILSWLVAFNVVNARNQFVSMVGDFLYRITEPVLRPIRNLMPNLGGIDLSPVIVILLIILIKDIIVRYIYPAVF